MLLILALSLVPQLRDSLTLDDALHRARLRRPVVSAATAGVVRARGTARLAALIPNPVAQLERDRLSPTHKVTATQSLAWLPRRGADLATGRAVVARARADSVQLLADVEREVVRAFYGALATRRQRELLDAQRVLADSLRAIAARRAQAGDISDLERDQVALEASRVGLVAAQGREAQRVASIELARAIAWEVGEAPAASGALDAGLDAGSSATSSGGPATDDATDRVPAVQAAAADRAAAAARLRAARIARVPVPGLVVGREWGRGTNATLGLAIPLPLWTRGSEAVEEARGAAAERAAMLDETRARVVAQLATARARVAESATRARFARDSLLPEAQRIRAGAVRRFDAGRTDILPVLEALRAEDDAGRTTVGAMLAFQEARADLGALLGRQP